MKRSRFSDEQIIAIVKEQEAGMATAEICRRHGISGATFYKWKSKYGGLEVSEAKRPRSLEDENAKLKRLLAEACSLIGVGRRIVRYAPTRLTTLGCDNACAISRANGGGSA
jgi:putative transposase